LRQPGPATETQSGVCILKEIDHVVQRQVLSFTDFLLEWLVNWILLPGKLPEDGEFLDGSILFLSSLLVFHVFDYDIRKDPWNQHVKKFELGHDLLSVDFLVQN